MATRKKQSSGRTNRNAGDIRRSQLITTYGPGAMVDLKDDAVIIQSVDAWKGRDYQKENADLRDARLQALINNALRQLQPPRALDPHAPFVSPPVSTDDHASPGQSRVGVSATTFPLRFVCQACNEIHRVESVRQKFGTNLHDCDNGDERSRRSVPVRFVVACKNGHIADFPWGDFVHFSDGERSACRSERLVLRDESADLSTARVECKECRASRSLMEAFANETALGPCRGRRPWIPGYLNIPPDKCDEVARPLVRTASNSWYSVIASALQLEREELSTREIVEALGLAEAAYDTYRQMRVDRDTLWAIVASAKQDVLAKHGADAVRKAFFMELDQQVTATGSDGIRAPEYRALMKSPPWEPGSLEGSLQRADAPKMLAHTLKEYPAGIGRIVRVDVLQELRAQIGFTRMHPCAPLDESSSATVPEGLQLAFEQVASLPAVLNRGEGIFFSLGEERLTKWEQRDAVIRRGKVLNGGDPDNERPARFYLLHTLCHLLMESLGTHCGYASTALRERLYWSNPGTEPMAGALIMTATPGTDGTLGGLADQASNLSLHLNRVRERALLCSNDPVCSTHPRPSESGRPTSAHLHRPTEGAACYACCYVAEPSCEAFNRFLDRAMVFPVIGQSPELAYFNGNEVF